MNLFFHQIRFVVLLVAWPSASAQEIDWPSAPDQTVWLAVSHESFGDGQAASRPIDASTATKLGQALERLAEEYGFYGDGLILHFLPGEYETHGIRLRPRWHVNGAGIDKTTLKLVPGARHRQIKSAYHSVISGGWGPQFSGEPGKQRMAKRDFDNLRIADLSLDCNWIGMKAVLGPSLKKTAGIDLLAKQARVERVLVSGFGAQGGRPSWREVFPIRVISAMGDGSKLLGYSDSIIEIRHCIVEGYVRGPSAGAAWPYCTAIMVSHRSADLANGRVDVRVHHNEVRDITNGIAFGGAFLKRAEFYENTVTNCGIGFNFDTGGNRGVVIRNNRFTGCVGGGSVNDGKTFEIRDNTFRLVAPGESRFAWWHSGLRIRDYTRGILVEGNRFVFDGESRSSGRGILLHGNNVGIRTFKNAEGDWQNEIDPNRFINNSYIGMLPNMAGPQKPGQPMHLVVGDRTIQLSGESDNPEFTWLDD